MDDELTAEFAEILGLLCAEGCHVIQYSSYWEANRGKPYFRRNKKSERIEFYNKDKKLLNHYQVLLGRQFSYFPKQTSFGKVIICKQNIIRLLIAHTELGHLKWKVPWQVIKGDVEVITSFIRGYFDGDRTASKNIRFFSTNKPSLSQIAYLLSELGFRCTFQNPMLKKGRKPLYSICIPLKQKEMFLRRIQPISKQPGMQGLPSKRSLEVP